jgi:hypothetical protein
MKSNLNVIVVEQPGEIGKMKARQLCAFLERYYEEHKEEVDRRVAELRAAREENPA